MQPAVAVLERMDENKAETEDGCGQHGIELVSFQQVIRLQQVGKQNRQILGPGRDVVRHRDLVAAAIAPDEAADPAQAISYEGLLWIEQRPLQVLQAADRELDVPGLRDDAPPAFETVARRGFALYSERAAAFVQQHEAYGAAEHGRVGAGHGGAGIGDQRGGAVRGQPLRAPDQWAKAGHAGQVVDLVAWGAGRRPGVILGRVNGRDVLRAVRLFYGEAATGHPFVKKPGPPSVNAETVRVDVIREVPGNVLLEQTAEYSEVGAFVFKCNAEVLYGRT